MQKAKLCILIILSLMILPIVKPISVAPASQEIFNDAELEKTITLYAINTKQVPVQVEVYASGDLEKYIHAPEDQFTLQPGETKPLKIYINIPSDLPIGTYNTKIGILEKTSASSGMSAQVAAESTLVLENTAGRLLLQPELIITPSDNDIIFTLSLENPTSDPLENIKSILTIYDSKEVLIHEESFLAFSIKPKSESKTSLTWRPPQNLAGELTAKALLIYQNNRVTTSKDFQISGPFVDIVNVKLEQNEDILKFKIKAKNYWTSSQEVYAEIISTHQGKVQGTTTSSTITILPGEQKEIIVFEEIEDLDNLKDYEFEIILHYGDEITSKKIKFGDYLNQTITAAASAEQEFSLTNTFIYLLIILTIVMLYMYNKPLTRNVKRK